MAKASDNFILVQVASGCFQSADCVHLSVHLEGFITSECYVSRGALTEFMQPIGLPLNLLKCNYYEEVFSYLCFKLSFAYGVVRSISADKPKSFLKITFINILT